MQLQANNRNSEKFPEEQVGAGYSSVKAENSVKNSDWILSVDGRAFPHIKTRCAGSVSF